jgi:hypothetical protein
MTNSRRCKREECIELYIMLQENKVIFLYLSLKLVTASIPERIKSAKIC